MRPGVLWVSLPTTWRLTTWDPEYSGRPVFQTAFKFRRKIKFQYLSTETLSLRRNIQNFIYRSQNLKRNREKISSCDENWFFICDIKIYMQYNVVLALANFWRVQHITAHSSLYFPKIANTDYLSNIENIILQFLN